MDHIFQAINDAVIILFRVVILDIISLQKFYPSVDIIPIGHVDQPQKFIFVKACI